MRGLKTIMPPSTTSIAATMMALIVILDNSIPAALALRTTKGSPCADVCHKTSTNTTSSEIVCLDSLYNTTATGSDFQNCVECELRSTYRDSSSGESDVMWGIYNLRYAFSSCVYGYPKQVANISSPCAGVSCESLDSAVNHNLSPPDPANPNSFCKFQSFADNIVTKCSFCYNMTSDQVYMANFIESVRYNCHYKTPPKKPFAIDPANIFKQISLPPSDPNQSKSSSKSAVAKNLTIIIVIPVLVGIVLFSVVAGCCIFFIRRRRREVRRHREAAQLQALWEEATTPIPQPWGSGSGSGSNSSPSDQATLASHTGGYGPGFGFSDAGGGGGGGYRDQEPGHKQKATHASLVEITEPAASVQNASQYYPQDRKEY